jgi:hypothetical protein
MRAEDLAELDDGDGGQVMGLTDLDGRSGTERGATELDTPSGLAVTDVRSQGAILSPRW